MLLEFFEGYIQRRANTDNAIIQTKAEFRMFLIIVEFLLPLRS